ncbi:hypothetical protein PR048_027099 [Dryococelus australis]|uniref:Uncharacterized protein n=1 Tax=Dryococelus australis TaxID=614101 RepID=A0ABQ9GEH6_9NEOP|nr:hypothetical protein PR048_027099 [Dryococelus australis]
MRKVPCVWETSFAAEISLINRCCQHSDQLTLSLIRLRGRCDVVVRLLVSHLGEQGSIPGEVAYGDSAGRNWAPVHNVCSAVVTQLEFRRAISCGYNSSHPVWHALYECLQDIHGDSSPFLLQPFHELSNVFWPRLVSPHPAIQFAPKMFYRVEFGALGGPVQSANIVVGVPLQSATPTSDLLTGKKSWKARNPSRMKEFQNIVSESFKKAAYLIPSEVIVEILMNTDLCRPLGSLAPISRLAETAPHTCPVTSPLYRHVTIAVEICVIKRTDEVKGGGGRGSCSSSPRLASAMLFARAGEPGRVGRPAPIAFHHRVNYTRLKAGLSRRYRSPEWTRASGKYNWNRTPPTTVHVWGIREIPEKTRQPRTSSGVIPTCENNGVTPPRIDSGSHRWEASSLTTVPPRPPFIKGILYMAWVFLTMLRALQSGKTYLPLGISKDRYRKSDMHSLCKFLVTQ